MHWLRKRSFRSIVVLPILTLLLATACAGAQGPAGSTGTSGSAGPAGPQGESGQQGPVGGMGFLGPRGAAGAEGAKGAKGDTGHQGVGGVQGPAGPVYGATIILAPAGDVSATQPVVLAAGGNPQYTIYGSGFPAGESLLVQMSGITARYVSGDTSTDKSGDFVNTWNAIAAAGVYTVKVTASPSNVAANTTVIVAVK